MNLLDDPGKLFGNDNGEEEDADFLKEVYIESSSYKRAVSDEKILCVRSRKGVGKSALLLRASLALAAADTSILRLSPSELTIESPSNDFNIEIKKAKQLIAKLCVGHIVQSIGSYANGDTATAVSWAEQDGFKTPNALSQVARTFASAVKASTVPIVPTSAAPRLLSRLAEGSPLVVFIDDLDRGWTPAGTGSNWISTIIAAIREIARDCPQVKFRMALREDVWQHLERRDEQMDKFRQYTEVLSCPPDSLIKILAQRIKIYLVEKAPHVLRGRGSDQSIIETLFEPSYRWNDETKMTHQVLVTLSRGRPRDLLQLVKGAATLAKNERQQKIRETDIRTEYQGNYSRVRALDLAKEFINECPSVETLIGAFSGKRQSWAMTHEQVMERIRSINGRIPIEIFGKRATDRDCLAFLYRCGFLSARKEEPGHLYANIHYEEVPQLIDTGMNVENFFWEPHPAFRPFLESIHISDYQKERRRKKNKPR